MNTRKALIGTGVAAALLAGGAVAWSAADPEAPAYAAGVVARHAQHAGFHGWHRGDRGGPGRGLAMICSDRRDRKIDDALAFVEGFVSFTPQQTAAWTELTKEVRAGSATVGQTCEKLETAGAPKTAPERLARIETVASTGLGVLQRIRPAFDRFYATLSDKQKAALENLISHRGRRS